MKLLRELQELNCEIRALREDVQTIKNRIPKSPDEQAIDSFIEKFIDDCPPNAYGKKHEFVHVEDFVPKPKTPEDLQRYLQNYANYLMGLKNPEVNTHDCAQNHH